jgi:hypothetical protein
MFGRRNSTPTTQTSVATSPPPLRPLEYPSGICVRVFEDYYYVKGNSLFKFVSERAAKSWAIPVAEGRAINISNYKINALMGFRDGTLIQNISDGKIYLVSGSKRRLVTDPDVLDWYGLNLSNVVVVSEKEASAHADGEDI